MNDEKKIEERIAQYQELAKENKKVDVGALAIFELQAKQMEEQVNTKKRRWAYLISASLPPVGLLFAAYYYASGKSDGKKTALICVIITIVTIVISWLLIRQIMSTFDTAGVTQIQDIDLNAYKELLE
jgi:uncharacterized membrane protein